jgi:hypothetical protein
MAEAGYFASRCKGGPSRRRKIVGHPPLLGRPACRPIALWKAVGAALSNMKGIIMI